MEKIRYYIDTEGNDDLAYHEAIQFACQLAENDSQLARIVLYIAAKKTTGWFNRLYGETTVKQLFYGIKFPSCKIPVKFETRITYQNSYGARDIVITCGLDDEDVIKLDDFPSVKIIIAIPWIRKNLNKWVERWRPLNIRGKHAAEPLEIELSCIVKKAMEELTNSINLSTGISHPSDNSRAKTYMLALFKYENSLDPNAVSNYLIRELKWPSLYAKDIEDLIVTLNAGRYFKGGERTGLKSYYSRWEQRCS